MLYFLQRNVFYFNGFVFCTRTNFFIKSDEMAVLIDWHSMSHAVSSTKRIGNESEKDLTFNFLFSIKKNLKNSYFYKLKFSFLFSKEKKKRKKELLVALNHRKDILRFVMKVQRSSNGKLNCGIGLWKIRNLEGR